MSTPPVARPVLSTRTHHGDTVTDDYAWLAHKDDPATIAYLEAENAFTAERTASQEGLRETIFNEIKARTKETDLSLPVRKGDWWYYARTVEGQQYAIHCRAPFDGSLPSVEDGPLPKEEILLDGNVEAGDSDFFSLGTLDVSPDGSLLAYSVDLSGDERFTLRIKDLRTGSVLPDQIEGVFYGSAWAKDCSTLFYLTVDDAWRPYRVWRHALGAVTDLMIFEEPDERFWVGVDLSRSEDFIFIDISSKTTSEVRYLPAADPTAPPLVVAPRRQGVEYSVEHDPGADRFLIIHNDGAADFSLAAAPTSSPALWTTLIPHSPGTRLAGVDAFVDHIVVSLRRDGLTGLRVLPRVGAAYDVTFPEPIYTVGLDANPAFDTTTVRLHYVSLATPDSVYDYALDTRELVLRKRRPVLGDFDPDQYEQHREWAIAPDGTRVPISILCRRSTPRDGQNLTLLYGYGSYESSMDPYFSIARLSLVDRGFIFALAHIRGGGEMGRHWYDEGKLMHKKNTFTDFIACAAHLAASGWTSPTRIVARGGSAGGLLMGAVANLAPTAFGGIIAEVPFVDCLNSILDPSLPLTVTEWEEWGNPLASPEAYAYIKSYSPYENVSAQTYPPLLVLGSLNDTRVLYHEPAKWVAKLRALSPASPVLLKTEMGAGHSGPSGRYDSWRDEAFVLAWAISLFPHHPSRHPSR